METELSFQSKERFADLARMLEFLKRVFEMGCNSFVHVVEADFGLGYDLCIHGEDVHAVLIIYIQRSIIGQLGVDWCNNIWYWLNWWWKISRT